jgi:hypothetical protein
LRVALVVLLLLAGIAITFPSWASAPFIPSRRGEVPRRGRIGASLCGYALPTAVALGGRLPSGDRSAVAGKHQRNHQRN